MTHKCSRKLIFCRLSDGRPEAETRITVIPKILALDRSASLQMRCIFSKSQEHLNRRCVSFTIPIKRWCASFFESIRQSCALHCVQVPTHSPYSMINVVIQYFFYYVYNSRVSAKTIKLNIGALQLLHALTYTQCVQIKKDSE